MQLNQTLFEDLSSLNIKFSILPIEHLDTLQNRMALSANYYPHEQEPLFSYNKDFSYDIASDMNSILTIAIYQPIHKVYFNYNDCRISTLIPPTYLANPYMGKTANSHHFQKLDYKVKEILQHHKHHMTPLNIPTKLTAVSSGLAEYGRNCLCYVNNSSFHWIKSYATDISIDPDDYPILDIKLMDACKNCNKCINNCPSNALSMENGFVNISRCITHYNENSEEIPNWLPKNWHNSLVGCLRCQSVCPLNRQALKDTKELVEFNAEETKMILDKVAEEDMPDSLVDKLRTIYILCEYDLLERNLRLLIRA